MRRAAPADEDGRLGLIAQVKSAASAGSGAGLDGKMCRNNSQSSVWELGQRTTGAAASAQTFTSNPSQPQNAQGRCARHHGLTHRLILPGQKRVRDAVGRRHGDLGGLRRRCRHRMWRRRQWHHIGCRLRHVRATETNSRPVEARRLGVGRSAQMFKHSDLHGPEWQSMYPPDQRRDVGHQAAAVSTGGTAVGRGRENPPAWRWWICRPPRTPFWRALAVAIRQCMGARKARTFGKLKQRLQANLTHPRCGECAHPAYRLAPTPAAAIRRRAEGVATPIPAA